MFSKLPNDTLIEILQYLPPSFIIRSARKVCRTLYDVSKNRALWMSISLYCCDYMITPVTNSVTTEGLERQLFRAEAVKAVWTGQRPGIPCRISKHSTINTDHNFLGLMDSYAVYDYQPWMFDSDDQRHVKPTYFLYNIRPRNGKSRLVFKYVLTSGLSSPRRQEIGGWRSHIMRDLSSLYVLYSQVERLPRGKESVYLKVVSITPKAADKFSVDTKLTYAVKNKLAEAARYVQLYSTLGPYTGCDYIVLQDAWDDCLPVHLISISTGKTVLCPHHSQKPKGKQTTVTIRMKLAPRYLVQFKDHLFELFLLPDAEELTKAKGIPWTSKAHTITLPFLEPTSSLASSEMFYSDIQLIPVSTTGFLALLTQRHARVFYFNTHSGNNDAEMDVPFYEMAGPGDGRSYVDYGKITALQVSGSNRSAMGIAFSGRSTGGCRLEPFWLSSERKLGGDTDAVTPLRLKIPKLRNSDGEQLEVYLRYVDPLFGRVALLTSDNRNDEEKLIIIDYVR